MDPRLPPNAPAWLDRLSRWLTPFEACFGHVAQRGAFRRYLVGLLSDSRRKSMSAMLARVSDPGSYQAFQHFITHAPWAPAPVWQQLRAVVPARTGVLILDATSFPKQGRASVGVARQYCGTLGKVANCQVAVTAALWTGAQSWLVGAALYLPREWVTPTGRARAGIPAAVVFREKWRQALTLLRQVRASGIAVTAVLGDADFGDHTTLRQALHRMGVPYALGISSHLTVFPVGAAPAAPAVAVRAVAAQLPAGAWRRVRWRNGPQHPPRTAVCAAVRVVPAQRWPHRRRAPEVWLLCERAAGGARTKHWLVALPAPTRLRAVVRLAHQRWAIEQQYLELKDELGLDHFEGRSWHGWHRHVVLTALAYAWLQTERRRAGAPRPTLPFVRGVIQEILTAHFFVTHPHYLDRLLQLKAIELRI